MAILFYVFGWLAIFGGGWVVAAAARSTADSVANTTDQFARAGAGLAFIAVGAPGLAVFFAGLLLLGLGCVIARLDRLVHASRFTAETLGDAYRVEPR